VLLVIVAVVNMTEPSVKKLAPFLRRRKRLTAYDVFSEFVNYSEDENGNQIADASGLLSKECYERWLSSRYPKPRAPEEGFQAALMNHYISKQGSKPFKPEVEASLRVLLQRRQVWECFEDTEKTIGINGILVLGYHESNSQIASSTQEEAVSSKRAAESAGFCDYRCENSSKTDILSEYNEETTSSESSNIIRHSTGKRVRHFASTRQKDKVYASEEEIGVVSFQGEQKYVDLAYELVERAEGQDQSLSAIFARVMLSTYRENLTTFLKYLDHTESVNLVSFPLFYSLDCNPDNNPVLKKSWMFPEHEQWIPDRPKSCFVCDMGFVIRSAESPEHIFEDEDPMNMPMSRYAGSSIEQALMYTHGMPSLKVRRKGWARRRIRLPGGRVKIVLLHTSIVPGVGIVTTLQDQSKEYERILSLPEAFY